MLNFSMTPRVGVSLSIATLLWLSPAQSSAVVIPTNASSPGGQLGFVPSAVDLGNVGNPALQSRTETGYAAFSFGASTSTPNALNDGVIGLTTGSTDPDLGTIAFDLDGTWSTTYTFNTTVFTAGYDISSIVSISAWPGGRTNQRYEVQYTTVSNGTPTSLGTFDYSPNLSSGTGDATQITLSDSAGPGVTIAGLNGVKSLIFNIQVPSSTVPPETVYREIDIFGQASPVPEPSALAIAVVGMALASRRFRRDRRVSQRDLIAV